MNEEYEIYHAQIVLNGDDKQTEFLLGYHGVTRIDNWMDINGYFTLLRVYYGDDYTDYYGKPILLGYTKRITDEVRKGIANGTIDKSLQKHPV